MVDIGRLRRPGGPAWPDALEDFPALMIPGPGALHDDELEILGSQLIAHYGYVWPSVHAEVVAAVGEVLGCDAPYLLPGTGSAGLDAALFNLFEPGERVVVPVTGYFGERLAEMARTHRLDVVDVQVEPGRAADVAAVRDALSRGADGLLCVHVETSTGVRHPVEVLARAARAAGARVLVDGIASAGGERVAVDDMGFDAFVTASQKGFEAPPGIAVVALGPRGRERLAARREPPQSWYFDLARWERHRRDDAWEPHPVTMPTTALIALLSSARRILDDGVSAWVERRARLARRCRDGLTGLGLRLVPEPGCEANLVVAAWASDPAAIVRRVAEDDGIMISGGLDPTAGRAVRIGLLGRNATEAMVDRVVGAIGRALGASEAR